MAVYLILPHTPVYLQVKSHEFDDVTYMYVYIYRTLAHTTAFVNIYNGTLQ